MGSVPTIRAFIAIELPGDIKQNLKVFISALKKEFGVSEIKWVNPDNIHLTLKFLGETELNTIQNITDQIKAISKSFSSPELQISGIGAFPDLRKPKVLWAGCSKSKELDYIFSRINSICVDLDFPAENRSFFPHLTIGRMKSMQSSLTIQKIQSYFNKYSSIKFGNFSAPHLAIYQSELKPAGPVYTVLQKINLS